MDRNGLEKVIKHFSHRHQLILVPIVYHHYLRRSGYKCYGCESIFYAAVYDDGSNSGKVIYACLEEECAFGLLRMKLRVFLCVACAGLVESVERHVLHPHHLRLKLARRSVGEGRECNACCDVISDRLFSYKCEDEECHFEVHVKCAHSLKPTVALPHHHSHPLTLIPRRKHENRLSWNCESCHSLIPGFSDFVRCVPCDLNYHISCEKGEYFIQDFILSPQAHPQHPLSLRATVSYWSCDVCYEKWNRPQMYVYDCLECSNFTAHISCVVRSFPCPFSKSVCDVVLDLGIKGGPVHENAHCQGCKKRNLSGFPLYGCQYCNFYLHESCIRRCLQQLELKGREEETIFSHLGYDLQHNDPLVLVFAHGQLHTCSCCGRACSGFMILAKDIEKHEFVVDLECMLLQQPTLELIGHDHPVILLHKGNNTKSSYLRCIQCRSNFSITESSYRFPCTIRHECHFHPLTLVTPLIGNNDTGEYYCDVCEDKRDPNECIYYCGECDFEAHIACVKSEILSPSANKLKDVKFVTLSEIKQNEEQQEKKINVRDVFRLEEEIQHSNPHMDEEFDGIFRIASTITWENSIGENPPYNNDKFLNKNLYSDESFRKFIEELNSASALKVARSTLESLKNEELVRVREYLVPLNFAEMLETLLDRYGDFGAKCTCSLEAKQYLFVGLICKALQSMWNEKIAYVTESLLIEWWTWLAIGKAAGFKVQFALEKLERGVYAHFGLKADKYAYGKLTTVREKLREVPEKMTELRRKLEEVTKELEELGRELEEAKTEEEELREDFRRKKSHLMNKCLMEAEDLVCYSFGELFIPPSE